jgi:hypothetical protein
MNFPFNLYLITYQGFPSQPRASHDPTEATSMSHHFTVPNWTPGDFSPGADSKQTNWRLPGLVNVDITNWKIHENPQKCYLAGEINYFDWAIFNSKLLVYQRLMAGWWYTYPSEKYESQLGSPLLCQDLPCLWQPEQLPAALGHQQKLLHFAQSPDLKCHGRPWNPWFSHQNGWNFHEIMDVNKPPTYCMFFSDHLKTVFWRCHFLFTRQNHLNIEIVIFFLHSWTGKKLK